jgi:hypothetical protein
MVVTGGARGIVTNGIHFSELACDVFGGAPEHVVGSVRSEAINPRSPDLGFYGGTAVWGWPGGAELVISYPLTSSLREDTTVVYRDAVITVTNQVDAVVRRRPPDDVAAHPAITWSGHPGEVVHDGPLPGVVTGPTRIETALAIVDQGDPTRVRLDHHVRALDMCIGAIEAGRTGTRVDLPIEPGSELGRRRWPIS